MRFPTLVSTITLAGVAFARPEGPPWYHHHHSSKTTTTTTTTTSSTTTSSTTTTHTPKPTQVCGAPINKAYAKEVVSQFEIDGIIPTLIEANTLGTPSVEVNVAYGDKAVNLGTYFTTTETINAPSLNFTAEAGFNPNTTFYMYFLIDPDVPENGSPAQVAYEHWAVYNAQPYCVTAQNPQTVVAYESPSPGSTTQHHYTFLVYRQPPGFTLSTTQVAALQIRTPFDVNDFAEDNGLVLVGGNYFNEAIDNGLQG